MLLHTHPWKHKSDGVSVTTVPTIKSQTLLQHKIFFLSPSPHTLDIDCFLHRLPSTIIPAMWDSPSVSWLWCPCVSTWKNICPSVFLGVNHFLLFSSLLCIFLLLYLSQCFYLWASLFSTSDCRTWPGNVFPSQLQKHCSHCRIHGWRVEQLCLF